MTATELRHDWTLQEARELFELPFNDLLFRAQSVHRQYFDPNEVQVSTLLSIKTGACPEDCKYCSQSGHHNTELEKEKLLDDTIIIVFGDNGRVDHRSIHWVYDTGYGKYSCRCAKPQPRKLFVLR